MPGHDLQTLIVTIGEVSAHTAVDVHIHKTGDHGGTLQIHSVSRTVFHQYLTEQTLVGDLKSTVYKLVLSSINSRIFVKHSKILRYRLFSTAVARSS